MTLFRVLSEEESKRVTRWQAPEIGADARVVANTRQQAKPTRPEVAAIVQPILGCLDLKRDPSKGRSSAPKLQKIAPVDVFASHASTRSHRMAGFSQADDQAEIAAAPASAEMLQAKYDEGYARGYADGSTALHQQRVMELNTIINGLSQAVECPDDAELEKELIAMSLDIARLVIHREASIDSQVLLSLVQAGLEQLPGSKGTSASVYLHPLDANAVRECLVESLSIRVVDAPELDRGQCRIESGFSIVSAGVDDWLHVVAAQLGLDESWRDGASENADTSTIPDVVDSSILEK